MPEWINASAFNLVGGSNYNASGAIVENNVYQRTTNFYILPTGTYKIKFIVEASSSATGSRLNIIAYDMDENFKYLVGTFITTPLQPNGTILSYQFEINEPLKVRFSYRSLLRLLGIEKL